MLRNNLFAPITAAVTAILLCNCSTIETDIEESAEFKKMKPHLAEAWKWSTPDTVWDAWHANHLLNEVDRWKFDQNTQGTALRAIEGEWRLEGPTNIGGRFNFIRQHPQDPATLLAGSSTGCRFGC